MFGFSVSQVKEMFAHAVVAFVVRGLDDGLLTPYDYYNAAGGLRSVVRALHIGLSTVITHTSAGATRITRQGGTYQVQDSAGRHHEADHVVLALSLYAAGPLVGQLAGTQTLTSAYERFRYLSARVTIHTDFVYMLRNRGDWFDFNVLTDDSWCEPFMWFGFFRDINVFKS